MLKGEKLKILTDFQEWYLKNEAQYSKVNRGVCRRLAKKFLQQQKTKKAEEGDGPPCPICDSTNTKPVEKRENNGILGSGFSSWVVDSYMSCQNCKSRFDV